MVPHVLDWDFLERLVVADSPWTGRRTAEPFGVLLRTLAVSVLFDLSGDDLEFQIADRRSLRGFIDGGEDCPPPTREAFEVFLCALRAEGLANAVFGYLDQARRRLDAMMGGGANALRVIQSCCREAPGVPDFLEPEWIDLESRFVCYWDTKRGRRPAPSLADLAGSAPPGLRPFLGMVRLADPPDHFIHEEIGHAIRERNGRGLEGHSIGRKARENTRQYGSPGLQGHLLENCQQSLETMRPVAMTCFFRNYQHQACRLWQAMAPVMASDGRQPDRLVFCALIKPILLA